jgi:hypothetical protein
MVVAKAGRTGNWRRINRNGKSSTDGLVSIQDRKTRISLWFDFYLIFNMIINLKEEINKNIMCSNTISIKIILLFSDDDLRVELQLHVDS